MLSIAGIGISFLFDRDLSELRIGEADSPLNERMSEDIRLRVHYGQLPEMKIKEKVFDSGDTWALYRSDEKYVLQNDTLESDSSPDTLVVLESDFKSGEAFINSEPLHQGLLFDPLGYPLNQILVILLLSLGKGIMLHACGIDDRGCGYLFLGHSGHGKSTMAKLWLKNNATILNDDRIIVREKAGKFWMHGTPWHGDFREWSLRSQLIRKMFFLHHGEKNSAFPKQGAEATSMLLTRCFPPIWDKKAMAYTTGLCHRMVNEIPCYELTFEPDKRIVDFVRGIPLSVV
ncbi:MAG: hypothetical protein PVG99_02675 [Desulfobacteraceae bacterium]|jgi:hypothetical protein